MTPVSGAIETFSTGPLLFGKQCCRPFRRASARSRHMNITLVNFHLLALQAFRPFRATISSFAIWTKLRFSWFYSLINRPKGMVRVELRETGQYILINGSPHRLDRTASSTQLIIFYPIFTRWFYNQLIATKYQFSIGQVTESRRP